MHFFHSYVLFKIKLGLYEGLAFLPWFGTENYTSVYTRLGLYAIIYGIYIYIYTHIKVKLRNRLHIPKSRSRYPVIHTQVETGYQPYLPK